MVKPMFKTNISELIEMKLKITNENYAAQIVRISNPRKHPNADKLLCWNVNLNNVITDLSGKEGLMVYFPVESKVSHKFLSENSIYKDPELNVDKEKKGYIEKNGRVRAMKLRGEFSEGMMLPIDSLAGFCDVSKLKEGDSFNFIDDQEVCEKYIPKESKSAGPSAGSLTDSPKQFVDGQFEFHVDTSNFGKNLFKFELGDLISISYKLHGTSFTARKVLAKRKFWKFNLAPKYKFVISSRKKILRQKGDKYDLWINTCSKLEPFIGDGVALYGEIVGYNETGTIIQSGYDYGCDPNGQIAPSNKTFIYRITYTSPDGRVFEYSNHQVVEFCKKFGLNYCPQFFTGTVKDYCDLHGVNTDDEDWRQNWAKSLKEVFNEKDCFMCRLKVPEEGVVIRKEGLTFDAYKLKSSRFLLKETEALDKDEEVLS